MAEKVIPRNDWVLVKPDDEPSKETESGLLRPDNVEEEKKAKGTVVAVGGDVKPDVQVGKRVIFGMYAGESINESPDPKHVDFYLLPDKEIIAFLESE